MNIRRTHGRLLLALAATVAAFCLFAPPRAMAQETALNEWCPVMPEEKADPSITTIYQGKTVAFCCDRCLAKFQLDPEKYLARLPQFVTPSDSAGGDEHGPQKAGHRDDHAHDHATPDGEAAAGATGGHQHQEPSNGETASPWLGRTHPLIVHFPVAGIPLALLGFLVWGATGRVAFAK
ncbi:MAG: YHS domain-containing protein, partial [Planctomycetota bacterium]